MVLIHRWCCSRRRYELWRTVYVEFDDVLLRIYFALQLTDLKPYKVFAVECVPKEDEYREVFLVFFTHVTVVRKMF